ncbi:MAG: hypothetical protein LBT76_02600 [Tannerella sp.]|jgi:hypothetical protein|nr:hypothetical protein [Tannerella sp.]
MDMRRVYVFLALAGLLFAGCSHEEGAPDVRRLIFNCDGTDLLGNFMFNRRPLSLADVNAYVDAYADTQVTTFMMCSGSHNLYYRSSFCRIVGEGKEDAAGGAYDDPENVAVYYQNYLNVEREEMDVIEAVLQRAYSRNMEAFISYRMNDLHFNAPDQSPLSYSDFWAEHPEYWTNEDTGWHSEGAFDFAHPEVRAFKTGIIGEQLDRYGHLLDGFELDFMRFIVYFKSGEGEKNAPLMTGLMKDVKEKIDAVSARTGRKIYLSARVPVDMDFALQKGLDVREWVRLGLVDFLTVGVHWCGNTAMPVIKFRRDLRREDIPIYATIDDGGYRPRENYSHAHYRGAASHLYAQGADGVYLFNYFMNSEYASDVEAGSQALRTKTPDLLHELGSPQTLRRRNKIFALDDGASEAYGYRPDTPLPLDVTTDRPATADVFIGDFLEADVPGEVVLFLRTARPVSLELTVNQTVVDDLHPEYITRLDRGNNLSGTETVYAFRFPAAALKRGNNAVGIRSTDGDVKVKRIEIALIYGEVQKHGYF